MDKVKVFADKFPYLGPVIWMLTVEYFIAQFIAAGAWQRPKYSWLHNTISDLGNTICGYSAGRPVCSPLHSIVNISLILLGVLMAAGSLFIYQEFKEKFSTLIGFSLMALAGLGTVLVGLFPENTIAVLHTTGAFMPFFFGNLSLLILGLSLYGVNFIFRAYTFISGVIPLVCLPLFISHQYMGLGIGGMERLLAYPQTVWLIFFGIYMSANHYIYRKKKRERSAPV